MNSSLRITRKPACAAKDSISAGKQITHYVILGEAGHLAGAVVAPIHVVGHRDGLAGGVECRTRRPDDFENAIDDCLHPRLWPPRQNRRPAPDVKKKDAAGREMPRRRGEYRALRSSSVV